MKKIVVFLAFIIFCKLSFSQETYTVNNETLQLKTEVEGTLDLLRNTIDGKFRYFIKTDDGTISELLNTKNSDKKYREEYKTTLYNSTNIDAYNVKLTTYSLKQYVDDFNKTQDASYQANETDKALALRLGVFGGVTNNPYVNNTTNEKVVFFGTELEVAAKGLPRQSGFLNIRYAGDKGAFKYKSTQIALGYRFRFVNSKKIALYAQTKLATYTFSTTEISYVNPANPSVVITEDVSGSALDAPIIFGLGADIKLGNGYITVVYDSLFGIAISNQGNFPIDFALGYKFNL